MTISFRAAMWGLAFSISVAPMGVEAEYGSDNAPRFQQISRYRDNLDFIVDRKTLPQFAPIGELESEKTH